MDGVLLQAHQLLWMSLFSAANRPLNKSAMIGAVNEENTVSSRGHGTEGQRNSSRHPDRPGYKIGSISELSRDVSQDLTPMQKELSYFVRRITWLALGIGLSFYHWLFIGNPFLDQSDLFAIGIIVANVPEGLLPTVTLALTRVFGAHGQAQRTGKTYSFRGDAGSTTSDLYRQDRYADAQQAACRDLYLNFKEINQRNRTDYDSLPAAREASEIMALCNDVLPPANHNGQKGFHGDPTEVALADFVEAHGGYGRIRDQFELLHSRPLRCRSQIYECHLPHCRWRTVYMTVKGAPDVIIDRCDRLHGEESFRALH